MYRKENLDMTRYRGLATDTKPDADFGSTFHEMDTGDIYRFDGSEWQKCGSLAGTDPSIYMSMWGAKENTKKAWELSALASGHSDTGIFKTVTGNPISVSDALAAKIKSLTVELSPIQDLHGQDAPYPAGGGKNKYDGVSSKTLASGGFVAGGGTLATSYRINLPAAEYKIIFNFTASTTTECRFFKADGTYFATGGKAVISGQNVVTLNCTEDIVGIGIYINAAGTASNIMICLSPVTDYSYAPYENICPISGRDSVTVWREASYDPSADPALTIQFGQTVYGGTVDVTGSKAHVTHELVDMSTIPWNPYAASNANVGKAYVYLADISPGFKTPINDSNVRSTAFRYIGAGDIKRMALYDIGNTSSTKAYLYLYLYDGEYHTRAEWQAKLAEMGAKIILPLAEPFDIDIAPATLSTLKGDNIVWSDGDSVEMTYKAVSS